MVRLLLLPSVHMHRILIELGRALARQELRITLTLLILNFEFEPLPEKYNSMGAHQRILRVPQQCYVRLKPCKNLLL